RALSACILFAFMTTIKNLTTYLIHHSTVLIHYSTTWNALYKGRKSFRDKFYSSFEKSCIFFSFTPKPIKPDRKHDRYSNHPTFSPAVPGSCLNYRTFSVISFI